VSDTPDAALYQSWARLALAPFDLGALELRFLGHNSGVAYRVRGSGQDLLLKIHIPNGSSEVLDPSCVEAALVWLAALSRMSPGFPVQTPLRTKDGELLPQVSLGGLSAAAPCSVQVWVDGDHLSVDLTEQHGVALGRMTARLHDCAAAWEPDSQLVVERHGAAWFSTRQEALLADLDRDLMGEKDRAAIDAAGEIVQQTLASVPMERRLFGPVHGDLHQENIVWVGQDPRPIDFAFLQLSPYAWDLGVLAYHTMYLPVNVRRALVDAYLDQQTGVTSDDLALEVFLVAAAFDNLAFQLSLPNQRGSALLARNLTKFARGYCTWLVERREFVLTSRPSA